jgi:hypothetical protein
MIVLPLNPAGLNCMKPSFRSFTVLLPVLAFILSILLVFGKTASYFYALKHAAHGSGVASMGAAPYNFVVPSDAFWPTAFLGATLWAQDRILILNAPAHFVDVLISHLVSGKPFWFPNSVGPAAWACLTLPIFNLPAWWYVGFGIDALLGRRRVGKKNMVLCLILVLFFGITAGVLRFGLGDDPGLQPGFIEGFTLWTFLFAIPLAAWLRQKLTNPKDAMKPEGSIAT